MKHRVVFFIILSLLVACAKPVDDPAAIEKARIEQLYSDIDKAIVAQSFTVAKGRLPEVKDETKKYDLFKRIITGDANIQNAQAYLSEIQTTGFLDDTELIDDLIQTLDDLLNRNFTYETLFTADQRSFINVLAVASYNILRENNTSHDAYSSFLSVFINQMNGETNYTGFDFNAFNSTISETDAIKIMRDAFDKGNFTEFEKNGTRVDVSSYGIGGPVGTVVFKSIDIQPTRLLLTYEFTRYNYDNTVYAVTTFELTVRYNPQSMFGLTIIGFHLNS